MTIVAPGGAQLPDAALVKYTDEQLFRRKFQEFVDSVSFINNGITSSNFGEFYSDAFILANLLELHLISRDDSKRSLLLKAVTQIARDGNKSPEAFRAALASLVRDELTKPTTNFYVLIPLDLNPTYSILPRSITALGTKFSFHNWGRLEHSFELNKWREQWRSKHANFAEMLSVPLVATIKERSVQNAFDKAMTAYELLRSVLNLKFTWARKSFSLGGPPRPLAGIFGPPVFGVFDDAKHHVETYALDRPIQEWASNSLTKDDFDRAKKHLRRLGVPDNDQTVKQLLVDGFTLYGEAVEALDWREAFMHFWRIIELITIPSKGEFSTKVIMRRAKTLLWRSTKYNDALHFAHEARNELIHRGRFSVEGYILVQMLKEVVETCLNTLAYLEPKYASWKQLEMYYDQAAALPGTPEKQDEYVKSINHIMKMQKMT